MTSNAWQTNQGMPDKGEALLTLLTLLDAIPDFVWIMRPDGSAAYANQRWCRYTGMTVEQIQGNGWLQFIHPDDLSRVQAVWEQAVRTGTTYEVEHRIQQGETREYRWFLARSLPYRDAQGTILCWVGTCTDIEAQKQAEHKFKESQDNWRILAETMPQLVWTMGADGRTDYNNQRFCAYTQARPEELQGYGWSQFLHPDDLERTFAAREHAFRTGAAYEVEYRLREGQTGKYRWFLARALPVHDEAGQVVKWFGTCTDIDEQKRIEEALRQSQERANALMNSNIIGINVIENGRVVDANEAFLHMTGFTRADIQSGRLTVKSLTAPEYWAQTCQAHQELASRQMLTPYEKEYLCQDGSRLPVLVGGVLLKREPLQAIAFILDNSARKELEQRKDSFIGIASHELRNPLTTLKLQATLLRRHLDRQNLPEAGQALDKMENQINTITRLVEELLDVSKIQAGRLEYLQEPVDLDALLREIAETMEQTNPQHHIRIHGSLPTLLSGDRDRLGQVFINLLSNAIKYSPNADTVELDLSSSSQVATIRVRDYGPGIPREQREKIFERFYRVNTPQQRSTRGLGMGLYIVAEIVKHHGGTISVESTPGQGSTFQVTLPLLSSPR